MENTKLGEQINAIKLETENLEKVIRDCIHVISAARGKLKAQQGELHAILEEVQESAQVSVFASRSLLAIGGKRFISDLNKGSICLVNVDNPEEYYPVSEFYDLFNVLAVIATHRTW